MADTATIDAVLASLEAGDKASLDALVPAFYSELHRLAGSFLAHERADHTLQPTALVHEAYLRLVGQRSVDWSSKAQIIALAATMMRRILIKHAQMRGARKRDWGQRVPLDDWLDLAGGRGLDMQPLDAALERLEGIDPRQARIVELRFFSGLTVEEIAAVMEISTATVKREWRTARLWLLREIERDTDESRRLAAN
jgi:RNA polymerase sigma-70 factor (ECF subfamily)